jgi:capsular exopolysaccharide synthesis family protein
METPLPSTLLIQPPITPAPVLELFRQLVRQKWLFVGVTVVVVIVATAVILALPVRYTATAAVSVSPIAPDPLQVASHDEGGLRDDDVATQAVLMASPDLAAIVVEKAGIGAATAPRSILIQWVCVKLDLVARFEGVCARPKPPTLQQRVSHFLDELKITPQPRTRVLDLAFTGPDPVAAAAALNTLIEVYQQKQIELRAADLARTSNWVSDRAEQLRQNWLAAEERAGAYRAGSGLTPTSAREGSQPLLMQQVAQAASSLATAQTELAAARARLGTLNTQPGTSDRSAYLNMRDEPGITALGTQLATLRVKRADLRSNFGEAHPDIKSIDKQITMLEQQIVLERARALQTVSVDVAVKQAAVDEAQRNLDRLKSGLNQVSSKQVDLTTLEQEATSARAVFETFLSRAKQLDDRAALLTSQVQFASHAAAPESPSFPNVPRFLLGGVMFGLLCGTGAALVRENLSRGFSNVSRVGRELALPLLCAIPYVSARRRGRLTDVAVGRPFSAAAESMRALAAQLQLGRGLGNAPRSIVIVSATGQEGKTTTALWLANAVATAGQRVLLIDGDHRRGAIDQRLGGKGGPGFSELVFGDAAVTEVMRRDRRHTFDYIGAGEAVSRPFGRQEVERLRAVIQGFEKEYDLVVMDTPPLLALTDALLYASVAAGTVFLCRWKRTSRQAVVSCLERLRAAEARVLGIVLSMVDHTRLPQFSDEHTSYDLRIMKRYYVPN